MASSSLHSSAQLYCLVLWSSSDIVHLKTEFFFAGPSLVRDDSLKTDRDVLSIMIGQNVQMIRVRSKVVEPSVLLFLRCDATMGQKLKPNCRRALSAPINM